jgi:hypothetical protein
MPSIKHRRRAKRHAEKLVEDSLDALDSGHIALADKLIQRALSAGPANARFWLEYARISQHRGRTRRAERAVRRALELSPEFADARTLLEQLVPPSESSSATEHVVVADEPPFFTDRTERFHWKSHGDELTLRGVTRLPSLLDVDEFALRDLFSHDEMFEHDVHMNDERGRLRYRFFPSAARSHHGAAHRALRAPRTCREPFQRARRRAAPLAIHAHRVPTRLRCGWSRPHVADLASVRAGRLQRLSPGRLRLDLLSATDGYQPRARPYRRRWRIRTRRRAAGQAQAHPHGAHGHRRRDHLLHARSTHTDRRALRSAAGDARRASRPRRALRSRDSVPRLRGHLTHSPRPTATRAQS